MLDLKAREGKYTAGKYKLHGVFALPLRDLFQLAPGEPTKIFRIIQDLIHFHLEKKKKKVIRVQLHWVTYKWSRGNTQWC